MRTDLDGSSSSTSIGNQSDRIRRNYFRFSLEWIESITRSRNPSVDLHDHGRSRCISSTRSSPSEHRLDAVQCGILRCSLRGYSKGKSCWALIVFTVICSSWCDTLLLIHRLAGRMPNATDGKKPWLISSFEHDVRLPWPQPMNSFRRQSKIHV